MTLKLSEQMGLVRVSSGVGLSEEQKKKAKAVP